MCAFFFVFLHPVLGAYGCGACVRCVGMRARQKIFDIVDLPQKERNFADLCEIICVCQKIVVLLRRKS